MDINDQQTQTKDKWVLWIMSLLSYVYKFMGPKAEQNCLSIATKGKNPRTWRVQLLQLSK
jgi:hypothetical protein